MPMNYHILTIYHNHPHQPLVRVGRNGLKDGFLRYVLFKSAKRKKTKEKNNQWNEMMMKIPQPPLPFDCNNIRSMTTLFICVTSISSFISFPSSSSLTVSDVSVSTKFSFQLDQKQISYSYWVFEINALDSAVFPFVCLCVFYLSSMIVGIFDELGYCFSLAVAFLSIAILFSTFGL